MASWCCWSPWPAWRSLSSSSTGVAEQVPAISKSIQDGIAKLEDFFNVSPDSTAGSSATDAGATGANIVAGLKGLTGFLVASVDSMVSLFFGTFIAAMVFFLVLLNPREAQGWVSRLLPWPAEQSQRLFTTSGRVIFDYYKGCTILAFVNAVPIWIVALVLDVKAAGAIFVVLFVSSYIPYIGAWIGGAFAVIMALGSGGTTDGWIMLAAVLVVNLGLQSVIQPFAFGATMKVSPLGVFLFTLLGGMLGGVVGAMMAAPDSRPHHPVQHRRTCSASVQCRIHRAIRRCPTGSRTPRVTRAVARLTPGRLPA